MNLSQQNQRVPLTRNSPSSERRGAVAVEFAIVAPVLLALAFGMLELTRIFETQNLLETAAREGARFATMDKEGLLNNGQSTNSKLADDVKSFLASNGLDPNDINVEVKDHESPTSDFDLDDPDNQLKLFEVQISIDYSSISMMPVPEGHDYNLLSKLVFRNGLATISE